MQISNLFFVLHHENYNLTIPQKDYFIGLKMIGGVHTNDNDISSPGIVFHIEKKLSHDVVVIERVRTTTTDWHYLYGHLLDVRLKTFGGYFVPAFGLEVFE